ncbi:hypothetical protein RND81_05G057600 [Saponaria officinalis]|uniref:CCT domain-containing protein n=1 Tax=Saponaria officinalis TaxID=3572 RepID=A0AAW1KY74_SAPOF
MRKSQELKDDISIPISDQIFDFCDDSDIFPDTLQNSEVTSSPNCCSYEDQNSPYNYNNDTKNNNFITTHQNIDINNNFQVEQNCSTTSTATTSALNHHNTSLPLIFDPQVDIDNDISASIDFSTPPPPLAYNFNTLSNNALSQYTTSLVVDPCVSLPLVVGPGIGLGPVFEDDNCLSTIPPFLRLNQHNSVTQSCTFLDQQTGILNHGLCNNDHNNNNPGIFCGNLLIASELQSKELEFEAENAGIFCSDHLVRYNSGEIQAFSNENSQLINGATNSSTISTEISSLDDSTYKVGKLSVEQRKEKIHRYMKKRNERNFCKKIKYACRKTLADSRPRVRGRFAKNDEFGEGHKHNNDQHDEDDYDEVGVKEGDEMVDSSDIFAHISGVNSFKYNYQIQSWM